MTQDVCVLPLAETQDVCIRVLLDNGERERIARIERDQRGRLFVRTALGRIYSAEHVIEILKGERADMTDYRVTFERRT